MQPMDTRRLLIVLVLFRHAYSVLTELNDNSYESILARAIVRVVFDVPVHRDREISTLHFVPFDSKQNDIINGALNHIPTSLAYAVEDMRQISVWYPRWFNIILISGEKEFSSFVEKLNENYFHPRGFYMVVIETVLSPEGRENLSRIVFKTFFSLFYDNVITLFRDEDGSTVFMYTFFPFDGPHACYEVVPMLHNTFNGETFEKEIWHFPEKWRNFNGCPVSVAVCHMEPFILLTETEQGKPQVGGIEGKILEEIASHFNFKIDYFISKERGVLYGNGTATGSFNTLIQGNASLLLGGNAANKHRLKYLSASLPHTQDEVVLALSVSQEYGSLERHVLPLRKEIWIIYFSIHGVAFIFFSILKRFKFYRFVIGDHTRSPFLDMFQMFYGIGFHRTPRYTFARSMFALWLLLAFIISNCYRCRLVEILTTSSSKSIPKTLKELDSLKYEMIIPPQMENYMKGLYGNDPRIKVATHQREHYLLELQVPTGRGRSVIGWSNLIKYFNARHYRNGVLPILNERQNSYPVVILFRKNSYLAPPFNKVLRHYVNSGLIYKWTDEVFNTTSTSAKQLRATVGPKVLNLSHFEGTFELYAMVMSISILVLGLELISLKWNSLRKIILFYTD